MTNLSQWFLLSEQTPREVGVYEVQSKHQPGDIGMYSFFDGRIFKYIMRDANSAFEKRSLHTFAEIVRWRGLSTNPEVKKKASGNRKVTRHIVYMKIDGCALMSKIFGIYESLAEAKKKQAMHRRSSLKTIRFRTPE